MQSFGDWSFKDVVSKNEVTRVGLTLMCPHVKKRLEEIKTQTYREKVASVSQRERPQENVACPPSDLRLENERLMFKSPRLQDGATAALATTPRTRRGSPFSGAPRRQRSTHFRRTDRTRTPRAGEGVYATGL